MSRLRRSLLIAAILLCGFAVWTATVTRPFVGHFDLMDAKWTVHAENTLRYGLIGVRFGDVYNVAPTTPDRFLYGNFHPPMITDLLLPGRALLGPHELATRITPLFITALAAAAIALLAERLFPGSGPLALFFAVFTPVVAYYSNIITQEGVNLLWIALALWCYSHWLEDERPRWRNGLVVLALLGGWTDWVYYLFVAYMLIHAALTIGRRRALRLWPQVAAVGVVGLLYVGVSLWQMPDFFARFLGGVTMRLTDTATPSAGGSTGYPGFWGYLGVMAVRLFQVFTPILILLAVLGGRRAWKSRGGSPQRTPGAQRNIPSVAASAAQMSLPLLPLATTLTFMLVLQREAHYIHDFLVLHLTIPLALYGAYGYRSVLYRFGKPSFVGRALLSVLLLLFLYSALSYLDVYRNYDYRPERAAWGLAIRPYVQPGEHIAGNVTASAENHRLAFGLTLAYYAGTDARWNVPPEAVLSGEAEIDFYVYCPPTLDDPDAPRELPAALAERAVSLFERDGCWFLDLKE